MGLGESRVQGVQASGKTKGNGDLGAKRCPNGMGLLTLGDARSLSGLVSTIPPLGSMLSFDADAKMTTARH